MSDPFQVAAVRCRRIEAALNALDAATREPQPPSEDQPVFVCALGWRCGSTLMQRLLMTDPSMLVWGEPMDRLGVLGHLAEIVAGVSADWPPNWHYYSHLDAVDPIHDWVANLSPDPADLKQGLRGLLDGWLAAPARRRGFTRWGVKEVRWPGDQALLLRWLYPQSRFIVLARHPVSAYHSLSRQGLGDGGGGWWIRWPDRHVGDLDSYGRYWNELAASWAKTAAALSAIVVRYEDLVAGRVDFDLLGERLGLALKPEAALAAHVTDYTTQRVLTSDERDRINAITADGRQLLNYGE